MGDRKIITDIDLLILLDQGYYASNIAKKYKISKQAVAKRIKNLSGEKLIKLSKTGTHDIRTLTCTPAKLYMLTPSGQYILKKSLNKHYHHPSSGGDLTPHDFSTESGSLTLPDFFRCYSANKIDFRKASVELHKLPVKIPIITSGTIPRDALPHRMKNWTKYIGQMHGMTYEITTKHIIIWARGQGKTREECINMACGLIRQAFGVFKEHLRWSLADYCIANLDKGKFGIIGVDDVKDMPPHTGKIAVLDKTPELNTIHPKDNNDVDKVVKGYNYVYEHKRDFDDLFSLNHRMKTLIDVIEGHFYVGNKKRIDEKREVV